MQTLIKEVMTEYPSIIPGNTSLREVAWIMTSRDCGVLPVGTWDKLEGIITDRDIVTRAVALGIDTSSSMVRDHMTTKVFYCNENDTLAQAAEKMRKYHVSRLIVKDARGRARSIVTFGCMLRKDKTLQEIGEVVERAVGKKAA